MHPRLQQTFDRVNEDGIRWCLLRWPTSLDAPTGDIDILLHAADVETWQAALGECGFVRLPVAVPDELVYVCYDRNSHQWLCFHAVTRFRFGSQWVHPPKLTATCLARRQEQDGLFVLANEDLFWTTLLHGLLDKGTLAEGHRRQLQQCYPAIRGDTPLAPLVRAVCPPRRTVQDFLNNVQGGKWFEIEALAPAMAKRWRRHGSLWARGHAVASSMGRVLARAYYRGRRGLSIALLGPDGAGKTTLAHAIEKRFILPVTLIYMGSGQAGIPFFARWRVPVLGSPGRLLLLWCRFLRSRLHKALGRLVVFDRYTYDAFLHQGDRVPWPYRMTRWLHARACPPPDLVLILDAPAEVMYARKGEQDLKALQGQREEYLRLRQRLPRVEVIDASRSPDLVEEDAMAHIWQTYAEHWQALQS